MLGTGVQRTLARLLHLIGTGAILKHLSVIVIIGILLCSQGAFSKAKPSRGVTKDAPGDTHADRFVPYGGYDPDPCYRSGNHDAADLCAQWRAALAAESSSHEARRATNWSIVATALSCVGLMGALLSLRQTKEALKDTKQATLIAGDTLRHTRDSDFVRDRAYLYAGDTKISSGPLPNSIRVEVQMQNFGQTPAIGCNFMMSKRICEDVANLDEIIGSLPDLSTDLSRTVVQGRHTVVSVDDIGQGDIEGAEKGLSKIIIIARAQYTDAIRGEKHETREVWDLKIEPTPSGHHISLVHIPRFWKGT